MCNLSDKPLKQKTATGYKVVAVHKQTNKFYSIAMGFEYENGKLVPIPKTQKPISMYFVPDILDKKMGIYKDLMKGRTAIFKREKDAVSLLESIVPYFNYRDMETTVFEPKVVKMRVSIDLLHGNYNGSNIIAGRKIKFLK